MNDVSKKLRCVLIRSGVELWIEEEKIEELIAIWKNSKETRVIKIGTEIINTFDIVGIFTPSVMADRTRRKNGQWKCEWNHWHNFRETCEHNRPELQNWTGRGLVETKSESLE